MSESERQLTADEILDYMELLVDKDKQHKAGKIRMTITFDITGPETSLRKGLSDLILLAPSQEGEPL